MEFRYLRKWVPISIAIGLVAGIGRLPVVEASAPEKLAGIITRVDIGNLYDSEVKSILKKNKTSQKL